MLGLSVWKGLRMRITSKPDWSASFCTSDAISATDLLLTFSSRTVPLTGGGTREGMSGKPGLKPAEATRRASRGRGVPGSRPPAAPLTVLRHHSGHGARPRVHVDDDPWVPSGEVGHLALHELPAGPSEGDCGDPDPVPSIPAPSAPVLPLPPASPGSAGRGRIPAEAEAEALQLLHVAAQPVVEDARQEAARSPARSHGYRAESGAGLTGDFRLRVRGLPGEFCFRGHSEWRVRATHAAD